MQVDFTATPSEYLALEDEEEELYKHVKISVSSAGLGDWTAAKRSLWFGDFKNPYAVLDFDGSLLHLPETKGKERKPDG